MRILQVSSARAFGGGERHLSDLARGLRGRGHELFVALAEGSPLRWRLSFLPEANVFTLPLRNALDLPGALRLSRLAREKEIDIVHAHVARDYTLASFAARRNARARLVITRHVLFPLSRAHRLALSNVSRVIAVSGAVARALRGQKIFEDEKIRVVENGVDLTRFEQAREKFRKEGRAGDGAPLRVGIVGEVSPVKGHVEFLHAAAQVAEVFGGGVEFFVVGDDLSRGGAYRERVSGVVEEWKLSGRVRFLGRLDEDELPRLLASLDLLVSASRSEAFGLAMVEALACGVPVVATATEGAREVVEDGADGLLVPVGDVNALAAAVVSLLRDEARRRAFGERAVEAASARFDIARTVEATERVYAEALGGGRAPGS
ncbi:MAG: glycosyltransferase family 4 protein [Acidobacteria bacterium]|nr:glycosyltransferase family 4 protein [Acidobacteriota bacterium]MCA1619806.1 glycosyltransferase family 4 protein [Acidobacteriota bacterium]